MKREEWINRMYQEQRSMSMFDCERLYDIHMEEVKTIVDPLVKMEEEIKELAPSSKYTDVEMTVLMVKFCNKYIKASRETLKLAGVE